MNENDNALKIGIVGAGVMAQIIHLPILKKMDAVDVVAICDVDYPKANMVASKFEIPRIFNDIERMLIYTPIDVLFILTPNNLHLPIALMALEKEIHLFIEKPAGRNQQEVKRIMKKAAEKNCQVMIGMQNRFRSDVQAIKAFLEQEEIGDIFFGKISWLQTFAENIKQTWFFKKNVAGGGVLLDLGIQLIDLVWWVTGKPKIHSVNATQFNIDDNFKVEDFLVAFLKFENNFSVVGEFSWNFPISKDKFDLEIFGRKGTCTLNPLRIQKLWNNQILNITPENRENPKNLFKQAYQKEIQHYFDFLKGRVTTLESSIEDAYQLMKVVDAIYKSMELNQEVVISHDA